jgi:hypothetical protein
MATAIAASEGMRVRSSAATMRARWCCVTWPISCASTEASSDSVCVVRSSVVCTPM